MSPWIGITLGDPTGIGPEVALKALRAEAGTDDCRYLLIGDLRQAERLNEQFGLGLEFEPYRGPESAGRFLFHDPLEEPLPAELTPGSPRAALAALAWLSAAARLCLRQELHAVVTAPVNKESILRTGQPFIGQTEYLSEIAGTSNTAMMLLGDDGQGHFLRVALVTTHVPLRLVADHLNSAKIGQVIDLSVRACRDLELTQARIGVCGLNPHAGEGGQLGSEEETMITPAVEAARQRGHSVCGPLAADSLFYHAYHGQYDAVVAMYHDQGLVPLKMIGFESGVNWTLGLPFVRTSPDHGTAYDIAGKGLAHAGSMRAAVRLAKKLVGTGPK